MCSVYLCVVRGVWYEEVSTCVYVDVCVCVMCHVCGMCLCVYMVYVCGCVSEVSGETNFKVVWVVEWCESHPTGLSHNRLTSGVGTL